jgi:hypothetical protein
MSISIRTAINIGWLALTLVVVLSLCTAVPIVLLDDAGLLSGYIAIPLGIILPLPVMMFCFHLTAIRWLKWAFMQVEDVYELEKALWISGFAAYSPESLEDKHPEKYKAIKQRFENYQFIDAKELPCEYVIYNKRFYQSGVFLFFTLLAILVSIGFYLSDIDEIGPSIIIPALFVVFAIFQYTNFSDRSPQIIINEEGVNISGKFSGWSDVSDYEIIPGKTSYLRLSAHAAKVETVIDYLNVSKIQLNHLMHIYWNRHRNSIQTMRC